jgi:NTP pyrophosphatase (non-canonical NTP hydrolase)
MWEQQHISAEESADLLILLMGTAISGKFDLNEAFWQKMEKINQRKSKMINGKIRVSVVASIDW